MVGILLAAGFSRRFGSADKLLQRLPDGCPIALASAQNLIKAIPNSVAVVRPENTELAELLKSAGLEVVLCNNSDQEMADSLVAAIRHTANSKAANDGFVIALADMPYISPATISSVATKLSSGASIVIPTYQGQRGHPVGFAAKFRQELESLHGDEGARAIIKRYPNELELLQCDDAGILADIDTPADLTN
jgi:molybdenum cofactor cytidylyltransferase